MPLQNYQLASWWTASRRLSPAELVADAIVHSVGLVIAAVGGALLLAAALQTAPAHWFTIAIYVGSLLLVLTISLAFNMWPPTAVKRLLARLDQASIFLMIAGTYTPVLAYLGAGRQGNVLLLTIWVVATAGAVLKLAVPHKFGRVAIVLYVGVGASGLLIFQTLADVLPPLSLGLMVGGGLLYIAGITFHLLERIPFHSAIWHGFVVTAAGLHLWGLAEFLVLTRH